MTGLNDKPTLSFSHIRLEPLTLQRENGLRETVCDGRLQELTVTSVPASGQVAVHVQAALATRTAFAVINKRGGRVVGSTDLCHIDETVPRVEIGFTWYVQSIRCTHVNTNCKPILLTYALETLGCVCVGWRTDIPNTASQHATKRLGAQKDGILHRHQIRRDSNVRDTVMYSMPHEEWPTAQAALRRRLEQETETR